MKNSIRRIAACGIGIALYVALSMTVKIPITGHAGLDLGYIVFAVYCCRYGSLAGACVGGIGCSLVSMLSNGQFPPGWCLGNVVAGLLVGLVCFRKGTRDERKPGVVLRMALAFLIVFLSVFVCKCAVECTLFNIPLAVKAPKTAVVAAIDGVCMAAGILLESRLPYVGVVAVRTGEG